VFVAQANATGIDELKAQGAKSDQVTKLYLDVRSVWFQFKRGMKLRGKASRAKYAHLLRDFYENNKLAKKMFSNYVEFRGFLNRHPPYKTVVTPEQGQSRQRSGFDFDRRVAATLRETYLDVYTSAGSRSEFDVIAIPRKSGKTVFAQCKLNRRLDPKDVKALNKFLLKAPTWAEVRLYYELDGVLAYTTLANENDVRWFSTGSESKRKQQGLRKPKTYDVTASETEISSEVTASVAIDMRSLMKRVKWTGLVGEFVNFYRDVEKLWPDVLGCRYNLAKHPDVDKKFSALFSKYKGFGVQKYIVFKSLRLKEFEPHVEVKTSTKRLFHRELTGRVEMAVLKVMKSGASYICRTDKTNDCEIAHVIRVRGQALEFAFCRASGLISKQEHAKLAIHFKLLPKYVSVRFYYAPKARKIAYKDFRTNLDWFTTQRGVESSSSASV
jgi:hypothetical protein